MVLKKHQARSFGFALPTILIASVVMIIVMLAGVQVVASIRVTLDNNYYNKMAEETAQAGITKAVECVKAFSSNEWDNGGSSGPLTPNSKCNGTDGGGYLISNSKVRSTYSVDQPVSSGNDVVISVNSTVELLRTSNSQPWKIFTSAQNAKLNLDASFSSF